jgi:5-methylcytosine-specific restriction endonuclease McrA
MRFEKGYTPWNKGLPREQSPWFGRHHSEQTKKKIGELKKGNKNSLGKHWIMPEEAKKKISKFNKGKHISDKQKEQIRVSKLGDKNPAKRADVRKKMSIAQQKTTEDNWHGFITPLNQQIRHSELYKEWRKKVMERDNYICQFCGKHGGWLEADHIKPFSKYPELRFNIDNGRTLCRPCHETTFKEVSS